MSADIWIAIGGDALVAASLVATVFVYKGERAASDLRDYKSALASLEATRNGITDWGPLYFERGYDDAAAEARSQQTFQIVMRRNYEQTFPVPVEPLAALLGQPGGVSKLIERDTIQAVNVALWRIGTFNQLVQQQANFNASRLAEIYDKDLPLDRRTALADAARAISRMLHGNGVGDGGWYRNLIEALDRNIDAVKRGLEEATLSKGIWKVPSAWLKGLFGAALLVWVVARALLGIPHGAGHSIESMRWAQVAADVALPVWIGCFAAILGLLAVRAHAALERAAST